MYLMHRILYRPLATFEEGEHIAPYSNNIKTKKDESSREDYFPKVHYFRHFEDRDNPLNEW